MKTENVNEWLKLSESGQVAAAEDFYYSTLFRDVIDEFCERHKSPLVKCNVLFSILGYSPEPIILTQRALNPEVHIIFTTDINDEEASRKIKNYLSQYLTSDFRILEVRDTSFNGIYNALKQQMILHPSQDYVIDITGGKKSMVASAAIFGRDYNCNIVYVDYTQYKSQIRKPLPGSERLNYVYTPSVNLPEIKFFSQNMPAVSQPKKKKTKIDSLEIRSVFNIALKKILDKTNDKETSWLPENVIIVRQTERLFSFVDKKTAGSIQLERAQLLNFFCKCKNRVALASNFITGGGQKARSLNPAIFILLNEINREMYKESF